MPLITFLLELDTIDIFMTLVAIVMLMRRDMCDKKYLIHPLFLKVADRLSGIEVEVEYTHTIAIINDRFYYFAAVFCIVLELNQLESVLFDRGAQISRKFRIHLKILGATRVTRSKFRTQDPQILGTTVQHLVGRGVCTPDLSNDIVISSDYAAGTNEQWIGCDVEESGPGPV
jgi:hypothetical protein